MSGFYEETNNIFRLRIPFDTVYTSVFLINTDGGFVLVDCATTDFDVDEYIIPALYEKGVDLSSVKKAVITHNHSDHAGGLKRLTEKIPHVEVIRTVERLDSSLCTYPLPGHTKDFIGVFDSRTNTLISGDGLQGAGVDKYRTSLADKSAYFETLNRIKSDPCVENILFSHAYEPWFKDTVFGRKAVLECVDTCRKYVTV